MSRNLSNCDIKENCVIVRQVEKLSYIFLKLNEAGIDVIDFEIKQKSLYDFFEKEDDE